MRKCSINFSFFRKPFSSLTLTQVSRRIADGHQITSRDLNGLCSEAAWKGASPREALTVLESLGSSSSGLTSSFFDALTTYLHDVATTLSPSEGARLLRCCASLYGVKDRLKAQHIAWLFELACADSAVFGPASAEEVALAWLSAQLLLKNAASPHQSLPLPRALSACTIQLEAALEGARICVMLQRPLPDFIAASLHTWLEASEVTPEQLLTLLRIIAELPPTAALNSILHMGSLACHRAAPLLTPAYAAEMLCLLNTIDASPCMAVPPVIARALLQLTEQFTPSDNNSLTLQYIKFLCCQNKSFQWLSGRLANERQQFCLSWIPAFATYLENLSDDEFLQFFRLLYANPPLWSDLFKNYEGIAPSPQEMFDLLQLRVFEVCDGDAVDLEGAVVLFNGIMRICLRQALLLAYPAISRLKDKIFELMRRSISSSEAIQPSPTMLYCSFIETAYLTPGFTPTKTDKARLIEIQELMIRANKKALGQTVDNELRSVVEASRSIGVVSPKWGI